MALSPLFFVPFWYILSVMTLRELRKSNNITIEEAAKITGLPTRTYIRYENDEARANTIKYDYAFSRLKSHFEITENKGILTTERIKEVLTPILENNNIEFCILFGSYAKGKATERSDVDLLIESKSDGIAFFNLIEDMREALHKKVDLVRLSDLESNSPLLPEILKDGVKIFG